VPISLGLVILAASKAEIAAQNEHGQPENILKPKTVAECRLRLSNFFKNIVQAQPASVRPKTLAFPAVLPGESG
jgi:hypothetical protein